MTKRAKVDPELLRQLDLHAADSTPVQAVFSITPEEELQAAPSPERTQQLAQELIGRAKRETQLAPLRLNIFRFMGSFAVEAAPEVIRYILKQPEIKSAAANRPSDEKKAAAME
jgi:hypothetical protein